MAVEPAKGQDLGKAIRRFSAMMTLNGVRNDFQRQRFHERPGLKRKRLKSERWRKMFKAGFNAVIQRVKYMTKKGW